jgi:bacterioferritin-associated ferredoxin
MQAAASLDVVVAVKDAEINMLRQQLAQLSSDLSRNLAVGVDCLCTCTAQLQQQYGLVSVSEHLACALQITPCMKTAT